MKWGWGRWFTEKRTDDVCLATFHFRPLLSLSNLLPLILFSLLFFIEPNLSSSLLHHLLILWHNWEKKHKRRKEHLKKNQTDSLTYGSEKLLLMTFTFPYICSFFASREKSLQLASFIPLCLISCPLYAFIGIYREGINEWNTNDLNVTKQTETHAPFLSIS